MLDHIGLSVSDLGKAKAFYLQALAPLGIELVMEVTKEQSGSDAFAGFGTFGRPFFWIGEGGPQPKGIHVAFTAPNRGVVVAFHQAALAAGGQDNGGPGLRPHYHPNYFGAFVLDPDGNNIEAVCHLPA